MNKTNKIIKISLLTSDNSIWFARTAPFENSEIRWISELCHKKAIFFILLQPKLTYDLIFWLGYEIEFTGSYVGLESIPYNNAHKMYWERAKRISFISFSLLHYKLGLFKKTKVV